MKDIGKLRDQEIVRGYDKSDKLITFGNKHENRVRQQIKIIDKSEN